MRDKVEKTGDPEAVDEEILEEVSEEVEMQGGGGLVEKAHRVNVRWPWLKILLAVFLIGVATLGVMMWRRDAGQITGETTEEVNMGEEGNEEAPSGEDKLGEEGVESKPEVKDPETSETPKTEVPDSTPSQGANKKMVALTFDDGPSAATTSRLLDILAEKQVKVTFFVLGNMAQRSPALIQREVAEGHEVASHTMSHQNLIKLSAAGIQGEVSGADAVLQSAIGSAAKLVRPPYGSINDTVRANVGKPMILWTVDPEDWKYKNAATVKANVVSKTFDGAIILMHDIYGTTVDAVGGIIDELRAAGYEFLTVSEMAAKRGVVLQNGCSYGSFRP